MRQETQTVQRLQLMLDRSVRILLDLKSRRSLTQKDQDDIDDTVESLQELCRQLPQLDTAPRKTLIVSAINHLIALWSRLRGTGY